MNIFKEIKSWFLKKDKLPESQTEHIPISIQFLLDSFGEPHIKISILDTSTNLAETFAEMIFGINEGDYAHNMLEILGKMSQQDEEIYRFITSVLLSWKKQKDKKLNSLLEPKIKPTDFLRSLNNGI